MAYPNPFQSIPSGLTGPCSDAIEITPDDTNDLSSVVRCLYIGAAGTIKIKTVAGNDVTFTVPSGTLLPWGAQRVYATGTTASGIVGGI